MKDTFRIRTSALVISIVIFQFVPGRATAEIPLQASAQLTTTGEITCRWRPGFGNGGVDFTVSALAVYDDGTGEALFVGGKGSTNIMKWDGDTWSPLNGPSGAGLNGEVEVMTVFDDGNGPALYVGGGFTTADGIPVNYIARWDGSSWSGLGTGFNSHVSALAVFDDGRGEALFAGGWFTAAGDNQTLFLARWTGGSWEWVWGLNGDVSSMVVFDDGNGEALYVGGSFPEAAGLEANSIAKWDGLTWSVLEGPLGIGLNGKPVSLVVFDEGGGEAVFAGGYFSAAGGVSAGGIARWNGSEWSAVFDSSGAGLDGAVEALAVIGDGPEKALFAGGRFHSAGGLEANNIARWDGIRWSGLEGPVANGTNGFILSLVGFDDGNGEAVFAGGSFTSAGGLAVLNLAKWSCDEDPAGCVGRIYVAAAASGAGANDSMWSTDLGINNGGDEPLTCKFQFLPRGADNTDVAFTQEFTVQPDTNANFTDIWALYTGGDGAGAINVCVSDSVTAGVISRTYNTSDAGTFGQTLVGMKGMTSEKLIITGEKARLGFLSENSAFRTNVGFMNAGGNTITLTAEFFAADGTSLGTATVDILPYSNNQWNRAFRKVTNEAVDLGYIDVWSDTENAMFLTYGSVVDNRTGDPTTIWPFNTDQRVGGSSFNCTPVWIAAAASAGGANNTVWATDIGINNLNSDPLTFRFQFLPRGSDNTGVEMTDPFTLAGNGAIAYRDVWSMSGAQGAGAINVCVDDGDAAGILSRTFNTGDEGSFGQMIEGMRGAEPVKVATGERVRLGYLFENDAYRTNIGFMNAGSNEINIQAEFFDMQGNSVGAKSITLAPYSNNQWNQAYASIGGGNIVAGFVDVWSDTPDADFLTYASIVDNGTGDPTTIWPFIKAP